MGETGMISCKGGLEREIRKYLGDTWSGYSSFNAR